LHFYKVFYVLAVFRAFLLKRIKFKGDTIMAKRKLTVSVLAVVLVLLLAVGVLAACNDTVQYTVTFKDGDTVVNTVKVDEGATLTADQIPAREKANAIFDGWYVGETKVEAGYKVTESVTAVAKFTDKVTVTFKKGDTTVETVTVAKGSTLAANQIPACQVGADQVFDGWFVDGTEVAEGYTVNANVTAVAKITDKVTVTFKVGEEVVKTVKINKGGKVAAADKPDDPQELGYTFDGWFNEDEEEIDEVEAINENVVFVAKLTKTAYVITFMANDQAVEQKVIAFTNEGDAVTVPAQFLPDAPAGEGNFVGWFLNDVKVVEDTTTVNADVNFTAVFVTKDSYVGAWLNNEAKISANIYMKDDKLHIDGFGIHNGADLTFDEDTAKVSYQDGSQFRIEMLAINGEILLEYTEYEWGDIDSPITTNYVLTKGEEVAYAGIYRASNSEFIKITDGGLIYSIAKDTVVNEVYYAIVEESDGSFTIESKSRIDGNLESKPASFDADGNLVSEGKIYVKVASEAAPYVEYYNGDIGTLRVFGEGAEATIVFSVKDDASYYAEVEGTIAEDEVLTINYVKADAPQNVTVKIVNGRLTGQGEEAGTYSGDNGALVLDGFGGGTLADNAITYEINAAGIVFVNDTAYAISGEAYTLPVADSFEGTYVTDGNYQVIIDGFGGMTYITSGGYNYYGTYEVNGTKLTSTVSSVSELDFIEDNKVLEQYSYYGNKYYIKQGAEIFDHIVDFVGYWTVNEGGTDYSLYITDERKLDSASIWVKVDGKYDYEITGNYNNSVLIYSVYESSNTQDYTLMVGSTDASNKTIVLSWSVRGEWDPIYEEFEMTEYTRTYTYAGAEPPVPPFEGFDADIQGTWEGTDAATSDPITVVVTQDAITLNDQDGYDISGVYEWGAYTYTFTVGEVWATTWCISIYDGTCTLWVSGDDSTSTTLTKQGAVADAFKGTWTNAKGDESYVFDGFGKLDIVSTITPLEGIDYTVKEDGSAEFIVGGYTKTATINGNVLTVSYEDEDTMSIINLDYTKQAETPVDDEFKGTWSNGTITVVFDGQGKGTWNKEDMTYEVAGTEITITANSGSMFYASVKSDTELFIFDEQDADLGIFTKQNEQQPEEPALDAFVGTWTGKVGLNNCTVICDGKGNININGDDYTYTISNDTISVGSFEITLNGEFMHVVIDYDYEGDLTKQA